MKKAKKPILPKATKKKFKSIWGTFLIPKFKLNPEKKCRRCGKSCSVYSLECKRPACLALKEKEEQEKKKAEEIRRAKPATIGEIEDLFEKYDKRYAD